MVARSSEPEPLADPLAARETIDRSAPRLVRSRADARPRVYPSALKDASRPQASRAARSDARAVALFALDSSVYLLSLIGILRFEALGAKVLLALLPCTLFGTRLLVLSHDAGHGSLAKSAWLNAVLGRLAFLPALIPFSLWQHNHNVLHHGFTNIRPHDINFTPVSYTEYVAMPWWRRALERAYRSGFGFPVWWYCAFYVPYFVLPSRSRVGRMRAAYLADWAMLVAYALGVAWLAGDLASALCAVFLPSFGVAMLLSFSGYVQHTHPAIPWFSLRSPWPYEEHQRRVTPDPGFPRWFNVFFHDVFDHTVHHADMRLPVYALHEAQTALLAGPRGDEIARYRFSLAAYLDIARRCKLYDYERGVWTDFEGNVTATP